MIDPFEPARAGDRRALARLISAIEDGTDEGLALAAAAYRRAGRAQTIGITGAPGSGKSTLLGRLALEYRRRGLTVGIIAVDPSSPYSGGAILGDRVRMPQISGDPGVYLRSMASRGSLGGLARATRNVLRALDACGFDRILVETVGAGQSEVDIARTAHTTVVVQVPGLGDRMQTLKAGVLEIADVLVVNKADRPDAAGTAAALEAMLDLGPERPWRPPVLRTVATRGEGVPELVDALERHMAYLGMSESAVERRSARVEDELRAILADELLQKALARLGAERMRRQVERLLQRETDPLAAARALLAMLDEPNDA